MPQHTPARPEGGIRRGPRRADEFTIITNAVVNDRRLSFRARGVLIWLLSKPVDWRTRSESIAAHSDKDGRDAVRSAMRELAELGYIMREKIQDPDSGRWSTTSTVYEEPRSAAHDSDSPKPENPTPGGPDAGNLGAIPSTDSQRTNTNQPSPEANDSRTESRATQKPVVVGSPNAEKLNTAQLAQLDQLAAACGKAGLTATFKFLKPDKALEIVDLVETHGISALVAHVHALHNPINATRYASGWIPMWRDMALPKAALAPKCDQCDEYGWLPDNAHGEAVKCPCRTPRH